MLEFEDGTIGSGPEPPPRLIQPREQVVRGQRFARNGGHECAHAYEEEERRQHRQGARGNARHDGVAVAGEMARDRKDDHRADDVVAGIGQAARQPSVMPAACALRRSAKCGSPNDERANTTNAA